MFKKMFGPKKVDGVGEPIPAEELRKILLEYFPKEGGINKYLSIEGCDGSPEGFNAVWRFYQWQFNGNYNDIRLCTPTVIVNIQPQEKSVYLELKSISQSARKPDNETVHKENEMLIRIGKIEDLRAVDKKKIPRGSLKILVEPITQNGWDVYYPKFL
jgi:hypothetical protein